MWSIVHKLKISHLKHSELIITPDLPSSVKAIKHINQFHLYDNLQGSHTWLFSL